MKEENGEGKKVGTGSGLTHEGEELQMKIKRRGR